MHEQIHWAAGARLPIVMCVVNRAVGAPWCIWNDHQDSISQRDTGWIQMYCCDHQQIIDTVIKAFSLAEAVSVPVMVCYDGYLLSHTYMPFEVPDEEKVARFLQPFKPAYALDPANPANLNTVTLPDVRMDVDGEMAHGYMEIRCLLQEDLRSALTVAQETEDSSRRSSGGAGTPSWSPIAATMPSTSWSAWVRSPTSCAMWWRCCGTKGIKVGVLGVRLYRPFPDRALAEALQRRARRVSSSRRRVSYGYEGAALL